MNCSVYRIIPFEYHHLNSMYNINEQMDDYLLIPTYK